MHQLTTPEGHFAALLAADPGRPFITYYDDACGERTELSARSLANWVAKTHHLLGDELGLGVADTAVLTLPAHWISVPVVLGCLTAGLALLDRGTDAAVAFVTPATVLDAAGVPDVYAIAPETAAVGFRGTPPAGAQDYVAAVRPQADAWAGVQLAATADDPCLSGRTRGEVAAHATSRAHDLGLTAGARVLTTRDWHGAADWMDTLLAPLAVGASIVYVRNCSDESVLARRGEQERATVRI